MLDCSDDFLRLTVFVVSCDTGYGSVYTVTCIQGPGSCMPYNVESGMIIVASSYLTKKSLSVSGTSFFSKI